MTEMLRFHGIEGNGMAVARAQEQVVVLYGIIELKASRIVSIRGKPVFTHFINVGVYALSPECLELIRSEKVMGLANLINAAIRQNLRSVGSTTSCPSSNRAPEHRSAPHPSRKPGIRHATPLSCGHALSERGPLHR
ncbi:hypothetical protein FBZ84_1345 [Azospirillum baldaniorum]|uniref:hypothetical protein n=1 Tax=Azospirillum baldaniorum TaxID=1064539 RepID=UPI0011A9245A|nr:hypothetical protein [Azospirillum baldaniorum]TWA53118.1 hypothetical protein FBZ84_1345 [Azospirillum baldaniorum]